MLSSDVVSRTNLPEVDNALQGAMREISTGYDIKDSTCSIERSDEILTIRADDVLKLRQAHELLRGYLVVQLLSENRKTGTAGLWTE